MAMMWRRMTMWIVGLAAGGAVLATNCRTLQPVSAATDCGCAERLMLPVAE